MHETTRNPVFAPEGTSGGAARPLDNHPGSDAGLRQRAGAPVFFRSTPCAHCGYDLLGLPQTGICPECGSTIGDSVLRDTDPQTRAKFLAAEEAAKETTVSVPKCTRCGYDLTGLPPGSLCPECGEPAKRTRAVTVTKRDTLGDAEPEYLLPLSLGLSLAGLSGLVFGVLFVFADRGLYGGVGQTIAVHGSLAALWLAGIALLLRQRPGAGADREHDAQGREWWTQRAFIAATQAAILPGTVFLIVAKAGTTAIAAAPGTPPGIVGWGGWWWLFGVCFLIALTGWPVLCYYMAKLADWAPDDSLSAHFRHTGSLIAAGAVISGLAYVGRGISPAIGLLVFMLGILILFFPVACGYMCILLLRTAAMVGWARRNAVARYERDARMIERSQRRADAMTARWMTATGEAAPPAADIDQALLRAVEAANERGDPAAAEAHEQARRLQMKNVHTLKPSGDGSGYAVEN